MLEELEYKNILEGHMISDFIGKKEFHEKQNLKIKIQNTKEFKKFNIEFEEEEKKSSPINFRKYFLLELRKNFNPLEIECSDKTFKIINKNLFIKKLNDLTFYYLKKYISKVKEVNLILARTKEGLKYENLEQEIEEGSILPYLFRIDKIKNIGNAAVETQTPEIYSGWNIPTVVTYITEKLDDLRIKINFKELLNEKKSHPNKIKGGFREILKIPVNERFDFDFSIKGYYSETSLISN